MNERPWEFGAVCAVLALLTYLPWRRRRIAPALQHALTSSERESRREGRSGQEYGVLGISALATLAARVVSRGGGGNRLGSTAFRRALTETIRRREWATINAASTFRTAAKAAP